MDGNKIFLPCVFVVSCTSFLCILLFQLCNGAELKICDFDAIYQLGASSSDIGNSIQVFPQAFYGKFPYGMTIGKTTGRASDGLLIIDYMAKSAGLPLLDPYLAANPILHSGVNFAFGGATALLMEDLARLNLNTTITRSLNVQLGWLDAFLKLRVCNTSEDCHKKLKSSLFVVGEIGNNDYRLAFFDGKTIEEVKTIVPLVVEGIKNGIKRIINLGVVQVVVPGSLPVGCSPSYLTKFSSNTSAVYDKFHCLKDFNDFFTYHNHHLQNAIDELKKEYPHANIIYGDLYEAFEWVLNHSSSLGFTSLNVSCCGIGGMYNYNLQFRKSCGAQGVPFCPNPNKYISWDGIHLTHTTNKYLAERLIDGVLPKLQCEADTV